MRTLFGDIFRLYGQYVDCIQINIHLLFALYLDENIIFALYAYYMDNMHMYLDCLQHYSQQTLLPDLMAEPCIDLGLLTGGGAAPDFFSSIFLFSHSSFSLCLCSSTASMVLSFFFSSSSLASLVFGSSLAEKEREKC